MSYGLSLVTPATSEPLDRDGLKQYLRVDADDTGQDAVIDECIASAREYAERFLGRQLITATWAMSLDGFPASGCIELPRDPVQSVTSIVYTDTDDVETTLATTEYAIDTTTEPTRIIQAYGTTWPVVVVNPGGLVITFVAGYGDAADVPPTIKQAMRLLVGADYGNRNASSAGIQVTRTGRAITHYFDRVHDLLRLNWDGVY